MSKFNDLIIWKLFSKAITITSVAFDRILANKLLFKEKLGVTCTDINLDNKGPLFKKIWNFVPIFVNRRFWPDNEFRRITNQTEGGLVI